MSAVNTLLATIQGAPAPSPWVPSPAPPASFLPTPPAVSSTGALFGARHTVNQSAPTATLPITTNSKFPIAASQLLLQASTNGYVV